jgi:hypothetical protein
MSARVTILALSLSGCAASEDRALPVAHPEQVTAVVSRTLHGDTRCPEHTRAAVDAATVGYYRMTDGRARLRVVWDLDAASLMAFANDPLVLCVERPPHQGGKTNGDVVAISPVACVDEYACALHELGHYLGLQHLRYGHGIMSATNPARSPSDGDFAELVRVGLYSTSPHRRDVTTVIVTVDPSVPNVQPDYPAETYRP